MNNKEYPDDISNQIRYGRMSPVPIIEEKETSISS